MTGEERGTVARGFFGGMRYLGRGLHLWVTSPRLMLLGAVPALVVGAFYTAGIVLFLLNVDAIVRWITPFADGWAEPAAVATRIAVGVALIGVALLVAVYTFAAVTLLVGDPFYERIWRAVELRLGAAPAEPDDGFWKSAALAVGNGLRLFALTALVGVGLLACGLIPLVGQFVAPVLGAVIGGWVLVLELTGFAFDARRFSLRERRRMLAQRRASSLGFGILTYLLFLVPFGAVVIMPAAVAGATMLSRDALSMRGDVERRGSSPTELR